MTTKHNCGGPVFGRKTPGCPRCDELLAGAAQVVQPWRKTAEQVRLDERVRRAADRAHFGPGGPHQRGARGPVCTYGDW